MTRTDEGLGGGFNIVVKTGTQQNTSVLLHKLKHRLSNILGECLRDSNCYIK